MPHRKNMGLFSFYTADTKKIIQVSGRGRTFPVALLIPKEFGGGKIVEKGYDGYGHFGGEDVYELLADWNRAYLTEDLLEEPTCNDYEEEEYYHRAVKWYAHQCKILRHFQQGKSD